MRKNWSYEETILALNLYLKTSYGRIHHLNPDIIELSKILDRSPNAVALKLANLASLDPALKKAGKKGFDHRSKMDDVIWEEYKENPEDLYFKSEEIWAKYNNKDLLQEFVVDEDIKGFDQLRSVKTRVNQELFRKRLLAIYNSKCPITGLDDDKLLLASHIIPWKDDKTNRLNPRNGVLLSALWDKAFDKGLISFSKDYEIIVSPNLKGVTREYFIEYKKAKVNFPKDFPPEIEFLEYHNNYVFLK